MLFNSFEFLFLFLPIIFIGYFTLLKYDKNGLAMLLLFISSIFFYSYANLKYTIVLLFSIVINFFIGKYLSNSSFTPKGKRTLFIGIIFNILLLAYFKYFNFFIDDLNIILKQDFFTSKIALPLGISFFTFQQLSYIIDSYKGETKDYDFISYGVFVTFFAKISAGPIVNHKEMLSQFSADENKKINFDNISRGLFILSIGLVKKIIISNEIALIANSGFDVAQNLNFFEAWITSLSFTFQLYFDFSGYCDMAYGIALLFNIVLPINFKSPYKASSIKDFWNQWHITLGRFLTKYVYIPLGGNRRGKLINYRNLFIVFLISGIWHGAGWNFIIWGSLHGLAVLFNKFWSDNNLKMNKYLGIFITFNFVNIGWIFFRALDLKSAFKVLSGMVNFKSISDLQMIQPKNIKLIILFLSLFIICFVISKLKYNKLYIKFIKIGLFIASSIIAFNLFSISNYYHLSDILINVEYSQDIIYSLMLIAISFIVAFTCKSSMEILDDFKYNNFTLFICIVFFFISIINLNKISVFLYFNF